MVFFDVSNYQPENECEKKKKKIILFVLLFCKVSCVSQFLVEEITFVKCSDIVKV